MKRAFIIILIITCILIFPSTVLAQIQSTGWTGNGLYLLSDHSIGLNKVDINITVNSDQTSTVIAEYDLENKDTNTANVYFGAPEHQVEFENFRSVVSPYLYGNSKVSGSQINNQVKDLKTNYESWRTWYSPFQPGEERKVEMSYTVDNQYISEGKYLISFDLHHINSWSSSPEEININVHFDNREVKVYNFGNEFSILPENVDENFTFRWSLDKIDQKNNSIDFDYYTVDREILSYLKTTGSNRIIEIVGEYENENYGEVIELGKKYIQNPSGEEFQKEVYFLMADAYLQEGQPRDGLIIYQLIEGEKIFYEGIEEKIQDFITYNKVNAYLETEDYKVLHPLLVAIGEDEGYSFVYREWANGQIDNIPEEVVKEIIKENRELTGFEKIWADLTSGEYNTMIVGIWIVAIIGGIVIYYIRERKKDGKYLFRK